MVQEKKLCNVVIFITLMLTSLAAADANNLIVNGNVEFGNLEGYYNTGGALLVSGDNGPTEAGGYCISADDGNNFATYPSCVMGGKTYVFHCDYNTAPGEAGTVAKAHLRFYDIDENVIGVVDVNLTGTGGNWVAGTPVSRVAPLGTKMLDVAFDSIATSFGPIRVDNIVVYQQNPGPVSYLDVNDSMLINADFNETTAFPPPNWFPPGWYRSADGNGTGDTNHFGIVVDGTRCADVNRFSATDPCIVELYSWRYSAKEPESFAVSFSYKTLAGTTGSARASFRCWDSNNVVREERYIWPLAPTNGQWVTKKACCIRVPEITAFVDVRFIIDQDCNMIGTLLIDNVTAIRTSTKGDLDCDCEINFSDFAMLAQKWLTTIKN